MWRLITDLPASPVAVELFYGAITVLYDQHGNEHSPMINPYRDIRRELGYWDGNTFCELGTGHDLFESWRSEKQKPTHWRKLPPVPEI